MARRRWALQVGAVVAAAVVIRTVYVLVVLRHVPPGLDAIWYTLQGGSLRHGTGYVVPTSLFHPPLRATAAFPPLYPAYQAIWQTLFGDGSNAVRLAGVVPGALTVVVAALLGRRVAGPRVGVLAAAVVAVDPVLIAVDGSSMSENLSVPLVAAAALLGLAITTDGASWPRVGMLGAVCGLVALTRQDAALLVPGLLVVAVGAAGGPGWRSRTVKVAAGVAVAGLIVGPWMVRNDHAVGSFSVSTISATSALIGGNCPQTYSGRSIGGWEFSCVAAATDPHLTERAQAARYQHDALAYARAHASRLPLVVAAREARVWGFWNPHDLVPREAVESRRAGWQDLAWVTRIALVLVGGAGLGLALRPSRRRWPLLAPLVLASVSAALGHGNPRFSAIADPVLAVGLALLVAAAWRRVTAPVPSAP